MAAALDLVNRWVESNAQRTLIALLLSARCSYQVSNQTAKDGHDKFAGSWIGFT